MIPLLLPSPRSYRALGWGDGAPSPPSFDRARANGGRPVEPPPVSLARGIAIDESLEDSSAIGALRAALAQRSAVMRTDPSEAALHVRWLAPTSADAQRVMREYDVTFVDSMRAEGYILVVDSGAAHVIGANAAGRFYGAMTLAQLIGGRDSTMKILRTVIRDWPAMRWRGLHDDWSRGPIPTVEYVKRQIRTVAQFKGNVYSPYLEHVVAYDSTSLAAPPGDNAVTLAELRELADYAAQWHVTFIPEQQSFGHLHHLLKWETYSPIGETPHGHVVAPDDPRALSLVRHQFAALDSIVPGSFFHIGADETFELGRYRSDARVSAAAQAAAGDRRAGVGRVYVDYLRRLADTLAPFGRTLLFWGDVAMHHPDLVAQLPPDLVAVAWWYDPLPSYERYIAPFRTANRPTWVAPGVSNWNRVWPNAYVASRNIAQFISDGQRLGAEGALITSWDDDGEALFAQTWQGVVTGLTRAWMEAGTFGAPEPSVAGSDAGQLRLENGGGLFDTNAFATFATHFHGGAWSRIASAHAALAAAHRALQDAGVGDGTDFLFWVDPWSPDGQRLTSQGDTAWRRVRLLAESAIRDITEARRVAPLDNPDALDALELGARRLSLIGMQFVFAEEIARMYARAHAESKGAYRGDLIRELNDISGPNGRMQDLRDQYGQIRDLYAAAWARENRPHALSPILARYDMAMQRWIARGEAIHWARQRWWREKSLPTAQELGIPARPVLPIGAP